MLELALHEEPAYLLSPLLFPPTKQKYTSLFLIARWLSFIVFALSTIPYETAAAGSYHGLVEYGGETVER